jgi:ribulose 1,5-bisphosphate synthetase/thiazole synthase
LGLRNVKTFSLSSSFLYNSKISHFFYPNTMTIQDNSIPAPPSQVDVLIVGGGPVGLLAANLIVQAGMTVRILGNLYTPAV